MKEQPSNGNIILYQTEDGKSKIEITLSIDYDPRAEVTMQFFKTMQKKIHF